MCEDNNGIWWGRGATDPSTAGPKGLKLCCEVAFWQHDHGQTISDNIYPLQSYGIRNNHYKLVINKKKSYDARRNECDDTTDTEFYEINEAPSPKLDTANEDLLAKRNQLTPVQQENFDELNLRLEVLLASQPYRPSDINLDGVVNNFDVGQWGRFRALTRDSS